MMKQTRSIVATLALSAAVLGGTGAYTSVLADKGDKPEKMTKAASERKDNEEAVKKVLAKALNDMLDNDGPAGLTDRLASKTADRLKPGLQKAYDDEYRKRVEDFQKTWTDKYKDKFQPEEHVDELNEGKYESFEWGDMNFMSVTFEATKYEREAEIRLMETGKGDWKIQFSRDLTGEELGKRISGMINRQLGIKSQWPKKESEAYASVTRNVLAALDYDKLGEMKKK